MFPASNESNSMIFDRRNPLSADRPDHVLGLKLLQVASPAGLLWPVLYQQRHGFEVTTKMMCGFSWFVNTYIYIDRCVCMYM